MCLFIHRTPGEKRDGSLSGFRGWSADQVVLKCEGDRPGAAKDCEPSSR
jgi:hypothetical protein